MFIKLICFIWGHKNVVEAFTGKTYDAGPHPLTGAPHTGHYYKLERKDFCVRCGAMTPRKDGKV